MEVLINKTLLQLVKGDITKEETEAIVNAANSALRGGGGVDGAIHAAGGPAIMEECRRIGGCPVGKAVITTGGKLKASYVIHTVGPVYRGGRENEAALLGSAYRESLRLASARGIRSIAFPGISIGVYGYPLKEASRVALETIAHYLKTKNDLTLVRLVLFNDEALAAYTDTLREILDNPDQELNLT
ncbi:MAG: O-acetyl-ADP-ribose deacetylase [Smithellaceae bacterium]|nr:O-acetyl-ADP-ribose deacetylase [Smithellaceae bacterium]